MILYFDCFSGASGDMILGALIDAGVPLSELRRALGTLAVDADDVWTERVLRAGVSATKFCVRGEDASHVHAHEHAHAGAATHAHDHGAHSHHHDQEGHDHHHAHDGGTAHSHDHSHRTLSEILELIDGSLLSSSGKDRAKQLFARLGDAEAAIHNTSPDQVHLHEVGALDSIIDIVGAVFALEWLAPDEVVSSPLNVGGGTIRSAHGLYPVPAPATLRLLDGVPIYAGQQQTELVTPTGALLIASYACRYGPLPHLRVSRVGYGAGARDLPDTPNVLRVLLGDADRDGRATTVVVSECEIDDMNPQIFGVLMDRLLSEGALDVLYTPVQMKKGRPGTLLTVVMPPEARERVTTVIFKETTTIGVRYTEMSRECLDRETVDVSTPLGTVRFKVARRAGQVLNAAPEFDDVLALADRHGTPIKDVQALVMKAFLDSRQRASGSGQG